MRIITTCLSLGTIIAGIIAMLCGFYIGILGIGPDGDVSSSARAIGFLVFIEGILYCIPNHVLIMNRYVARSFLIATSLPVIFLTGMLFLSGIQLFQYDRFLFFLWGCTFALLCFPPVSLWIFIRYAGSSNNALQAIGAKARLQPER